MLWEFSHPRARKETPKGLWKEEAANYSAKYAKCCSSPFPEPASSSHSFSRRGQPAVLGEPTAAPTRVLLIPDPGSALPWFRQCRAAV